MSSGTHLAAVVILLLGTRNGVDSHSYRSARAGRDRFNTWPAFTSNSPDNGPFRAFNVNPRGGGILSSATPLVDVFQEVFGDIKKAARELSDSHRDGSSRTPPHEVFEGSGSVIVSIDLPGCKKQDVDAKISQDAGVKTLTITAVRKKMLPSGPASGDPDSPAAETAGKFAANAKGAGVSTKTSPPPPSLVEENFELSFRVGDGIDVSGIRGTHEDGVLTLVLPRLAPEPAAQPIEIPIDPPAGSGQDGRVSEGHEVSSSGDGGLARNKGVDAVASADTHISLS